MATETSEALSPKTIALLRKDMDLYAKSVLKIRTTKPSIEPLTINNAQRILENKLENQREETGRVRAIVLKARQEGVSTWVGARFYRKVHLWANMAALIVADKIDRSSTLFNIYDRFKTYTPDEIRPMVRNTTKQKEVIFDNPDDDDRARNPGLGSMIQVETAGDPDAGRSKTVQLLHASELAFWPNPQDSWLGLANAVPNEPGTEIIIESTANGIGNFFHDIWQLAESGESEYIAIFLPWWVHEPYRIKLSEWDKKKLAEDLDETERSYIEEGIEYEGRREKLTLEQIAWRRKKIRDDFFGNERAFRQEFPATAEEAFLVSGNSFFDEEVTKKYQQSATDPTFRGNVVQLKDGSLQAKKSELGYLKVWEMPQPQATYVIAADTASGKQVSAETNRFSDPESEKGGRDFSCATVFRADTWSMVAQLHGRMAPDIFAYQLWLLGYFYSSNELKAALSQPAYLAVEKNHSSGETVINRLQTGTAKHAPYPRLHRQRQINRRTNRATETVGWVTSVETRMPMLDNLAADVREEAIGIPDKQTIKEMMSFIRGDDGKPQAQEGTHDDRVIALAIARQVASTASLTLPKHYAEPEKVSVGNSPTGWFDWDAPSEQNWN